MATRANPFQPHPLPATCPSCGGTDFSSLEMIHAAGSSRGSGLVAGTAHGSMGYGTVFSRQQSDLARSVAPPRAATGCLGAFAMVMTGIVVTTLMLVLNVDPLASALIGFVGGILIGGAIWYPQWRFRRDELPKLLHEWRQTFMCQRCGYRFRR